MEHVVNNPSGAPTKTKSGYGKTKKMGYSKPARKPAASRTVRGMRGGSARSRTSSRYAK